MKTISIIFALLALICAFASAIITIVNMDFTPAGLATMAFSSMIITVLTDRRS